MNPNGQQHHNTNQHQHHAAIKHHLKPFFISRATNEITQFPSYETMTQLTTNQLNNSSNTTNNNNTPNNNNQNTNSVGSPLSKSQAIIGSITNNVLLNQYHANNISSSTINSIQPPPTPPPHQIPPPTNYLPPPSTLGVVSLLKYLKLNHHSNQNNQTSDHHPSITSFLPLTLVLFASHLVTLVATFHAIPFINRLAPSKGSRFILSSSFPLAALLAPPYVATRSDLQFTHPHRRRNCIATSTLVIVFSLLSLSFSQPLGSTLTYILRLDQGDWDPNQKIYSKSAAISIAIVSIYLLSFSINSLNQASKSLILDQIPAENQLEISIWLNRMIQLANLLLFTFAYYSPQPSPDHPILLRKLVGLTIPTLIISSLITCILEVERPSFEKEVGNHSQSTDHPNRPVQIKQQIKLFINTLKNLPIPIRRVCYVEFLSSSCWLTIYYLAKPLVTQFKLIELLQSKKNLKFSSRLLELSETEGNRAMLSLSTVSFITSWLLPSLALMGTTDFIINRRGKRWNHLRRLISFITPRTLWSISLVFYTLIIITCSFTIQTSSGAILFVSSLGFFFAAAQWVPLSLVMEYIRSIEETTVVNLDLDGDQPSVIAVIGSPLPSSSPQIRIPKFEPRLSEQTPLVIGATTTFPTNGLSFLRSKQLATVRGATFLSFFALASVLPHFLISILTWSMMNMNDLTSTPITTTATTTTTITTNTIETTEVIIERVRSWIQETLWIFKLTSILSLFGVLLARKLIVPTTELDYCDEIKFQIFQNNTHHHYNPHQNSHTGGPPGGNQNSLHHHSHDHF